MQNYISTQTIAVRKVIGIVWKISLMVRMGNNPSGSRPNFFGRQHLTFDKGGKGGGAGRGIVRFWKGWCRANCGRANALKFYG